MAVGGIVLIGLGNEFRGDDAIGLMVARAVEDRNLPGVVVRAGAADGTELLDLWCDARAVFVVDCVRAEAPVGTVYRFDGLAETLPEIEFTPFSTHAFSVDKTIRLARTMNRLPERLVVYGIVGERLGPGESMSEPVERAAQEVAANIADEIRNLPAERPSGR